MAFVDIQVLGQTVLYIVVCICGFLVAIPIGITKACMGFCALYSDVVNKETHIQFQQETPSKCFFPMYFGIFGMILFGFQMSLYNGYAVFRSFRDRDVGRKMWVFPFIITNAVVCFISLISACMISVGFRHLCDEISGVGGIECEALENVKFRDGKHNTGDFYTNYTIAETSNWIAFLAEVVLVFLYVLRIFRNRHAGREQAKISRLPLKMGNSKF